MQKSQYQVTLALFNAGKTLNERQLSAQHVGCCASLVQKFKQPAVQCSEDIRTFDWRQLIADVLAV